MTDYSTLTKDTLEYVRNTLRNDSTLVNSILSISGGTTGAINNIFVGRPASETGTDFPLPRIIVNQIDTIRGRMGDNQDGRFNSQVQFQVSFWVNEQPWSLAFETHDRIGNLLESDNMPLTEGFSRFQVTGGEIIEDPDRMRTKQGNLRFTAIIEGGN